MFSEVVFGYLNTVVLHSLVDLSLFCPFSRCAGCLPGTFGEDCKLTCESCLNGADCNFNLNGCDCAPGWFGLVCDEPCPQVSYCTALDLDINTGQYLVLKQLTPFLSFGHVAYEKYMAVSLVQQSVQSIAAEAVMNLD